MKKLLKNVGLAALLLFAIVIGNQQKAYAHCEIPCGIYADSLRIVMISEDIATIEKSMNEINNLSASESINYNQLVRWINNKELHANKIQQIATQYFMFQRVKLTDDAVKQKKNLQMLSLLHEICVYAMKTKQTTDLKYVEKLKHLLQEFSELYFEASGHHHH
ncbi:superoxide dismutase [Ni] [Ancylomarina longa]|uniref:Superoxide dismutase n=1 Tax=Ancylomarina longa TaxID=2487017 RepID=A0A434ATB2_9BACT|nr:superoxide dismutase [Ni] [Ancylomarina longa]RUT77646.1 superoxide dismutase [Ancylomarina longa]